MKEPFRTSRRVEFGDTDMAGIAHFANFFRYMEQAETDFLHSLGTSVSWSVGQERFGFPRVNVSCDYKRPAKFEDILDIVVSLEEVGRKSLKYRFDFSRAGQEIAVGRITSVFCRHSTERGLESLELDPLLRQKLEGS